MFHNYHEYQRFRINLAMLKSLLTTFELRSIFKAAGALVKIGTSQVKLV